MPAQTREEEARLEAAFRLLRRELEGLTDEECDAFRVKGWPRHVHWCGQDGSIRGLIRHVGSWKTALAIGLETGQSVDPSTLKPPPRDAAGAVRWLEAAHHHMMESLRPFLNDPPREWPALELLEGMDLPRTVAIWEDHDRYHMAQVIYLRQRFRALNTR